MALNTLLPVNSVDQNRQEYVTYWQLKTTSTGASPCIVVLLKPLFSERAGQKLWVNRGKNPPAK